MTEPSAEDVARERKHLEVITRLACEYCGALEMDYKDGRGPNVPEWARVWWEDHKAADQTKVELERERKANLRFKALGKLTAEGREALGL